jgi:hypothetical protein
MSRAESESDNKVTPPAVRDLIVTDQEGNEIEGAVINLGRAHVLHFRLEFDLSPSSSRYRVTVVIHRRGRTSTAQAGEIRNARFTTTFTHIIPVFLTPPRLEFDIVDTTPHRWHDGPGSYDSAIALTPLEQDGTPIESETSAVSYDFVGIGS